MAVDRKFGYLRVVLNCLQAYEANLCKLVIFNIHIFHMLFLFFMQVYIRITASEHCFISETIIRSFEM